MSAQRKLFAAVATYPYSYRVFIPQVKEILHLDVIEHHEKFKGCLYVLLGSQSAPLITRHDWQTIRDLWPLLVRSKPSEKPSIVNLMTALIDAVKRVFPTISIKFDIPEQHLTAAYAFAALFPKVTLDGAFKAVISSGPERLKLQNEARLSAYNDTIQLLLNGCTVGQL